MTLVTIDAVVHIPIDVRVAEIIGIVAAMAARALEHRIVVGVRVARGANSVGVAMIDRKTRVLRVVEGCACPRGGVVAVLACCREELRLSLVTRIGRVVVIGLMATDAGRGQSGVVAVDVAFGALPRRNRVRSRQREGGVVVVERRICPDSRVMTDLARSGEASGGVRRVGGTRVVLLMARVAQRAVQ